MRPGKESGYGKLASSKKYLFMVLLVGLALVIGINVAAAQEGKKTNRGRTEKGAATMLKA